MTGENCHVYGSENSMLAPLFSPEWFIDSVAIQMKILAGCFVEVDNLILKSIWKCKEARVVKATLKKRTKLEN